MIVPVSMLRGLVALALLLPLHLAHAQGARFPEKPVRVLVGYAPGGLPDTVARVVSQKMSERWGQQVVIENRAGANSGLAAELVMNAAPDGYTLLVTDNSTHAINPFLYRKLPYDPAKLLPVALVARAPLYLAAHSSFPANNPAEAIALLKANPGKFTYGSSGIGSTHRLCMEFFKAALGLDMAHVPYKGTGQSVPAVIAGQVPLVWSAYPSLSGSAKDGRIKLLAVNSIGRSASAPGLPAMSETIPGFDFAPTVGYFAPAGTPRELIARISADASEAAKSPEVTAKLAGLDIQSVGSTPEEYAAALKADESRYAKVVKISGATAD